MLSFLNLMRSPALHTLSSLLAVTYLERTVFTSDWAMNKSNATCLAPLQKALDQEPGASGLARQLAQLQLAGGDAQGGWGILALL